MAWDEWEQLKMAAAERSSARMELNQRVHEGGGGGRSPSSDGHGGPGTLRHSKQPWHRAADVADELRIAMNNAKRDLDDGSKDTATGLSGLDLLSTLATVRTSWKGRVSSVRAECGALRPKLLAVSRTLGETDQGVSDGVSHVHAPHSWTEKR